MRKEFQNQDDSQAEQGYAASSGEQYVQPNAGQTQQEQYPSVPAQFVPPQNQPGQYSQTATPQAWYPGSQNPQASYQQPQQYQQDPYSQQQYSPSEYQNNPYTGQQSAPSQFQQAPYSQHQYPTGYGQTQGAYQQGAQSYGGDQYVSYDQKASRIVGGVLGTLLLAAVLWGLFWVYKATHLPPVLAPTAYTQFYVGDGGFSIAQPAGWTSDSGGSNGVESNATFVSGKAKIYADSDLGGSLNGDMITASNNQQQEAADQLGKQITLTPPVVTLHREGAAAMSDLYGKYQEQPMQQFQSNLGAGWYSEFTGIGGTFTGPVHGYRATILSNDRRVTAILVCRQSDWAALQAPYMHVLQSIDHGKSTQ